MQLLSSDLEEDYSLIGIHSTEEDYRLAYLLNSYLKFKLTRYKDYLDFQDSTAEFPLFEFKDELNFINYYKINQQGAFFVKRNTTKKREQPVLLKYFLKTLR